MLRLLILLVCGALSGCLETQAPSGAFIRLVDTITGEVVFMAPVEFKAGAYSVRSHRTVKYPAIAALQGDSVSYVQEASFSDSFDFMLSAYKTVGGERVRHTASSVHEYFGKGRSVDFEVVYDFAYVREYSRFDVDEGVFVERPVVISSSGLEPFIYSPGSPFNGLELPQGAALQLIFGSLYDDSSN